MQTLIKQIPNMFTLSNLTCGVLGILQVFSGNPTLAFWLMLLAATLDFFDGFLARLLKADGELGKQLDSLADAVTFGVLPGFIWYYYINQLGYCKPTGFCINTYVFLCIPIAAVYRLAKFNIDTRQTTGFIGTPTPITGLAIASCTFIFSNPNHWLSSQFYFLLLFPLFTAYLMVSELPMFAFKFKKADPQIAFKIVFLTFAAASIIFFLKLAGLIIYCLYVVISLISQLKYKSK